VIDGLKRQHDGENLVGLAIPDQLHLALVRKEQKTILLRQRLVRLKIPDNLLSFLFRQTRHKPSAPASGESFWT